MPYENEIVDARGYSSEDKERASLAEQEVVAQLTANIEAKLGRPIEDGEIEERGVRKIQPNGNWCFEWDGDVVLFVEFHADKIIMHNK